MSFNTNIIDVRSGRSWTCEITVNTENWFIYTFLESQKSRCVASLAFRSARTAGRLGADGKHPHLCLLSEEETRFVCLAVWIAASCSRVCTSNSVIISKKAKVIIYTSAHLLKGCYATHYILNVESLILSAQGLKNLLCVCVCVCVCVRARVRTRPCVFVEVYFKNIKLWDGFSENDHIWDGRLFVWSWFPAPSPPSTLFFSFWCFLVACDAFGLVNQR